MRRAIQVAGQNFVLSICWNAVAGVAWLSAGAVVTGNWIWWWSNRAAQVSVCCWWRSKPGVDVVLMAGEW